MAIYSCSLIVDTQSSQCAKDDDCKQFGSGATCETTSGVCVGMGTGTGSGSSGSASSSSSASSSGATTCEADGGLDGGGCYAASCLTSTSDNAELLNACTTGCVPFDNAARVPGLLPGDQLPGLPAQGPNDAGM